MGALSDIAQINISAQTVAIKQTGFGIPLIADFHTRFAERVRSYANTQAMIADGFTVNDAAYRAAAQAFAQSPQVERVKIGRRALAPDLQVDLFPAAVNLAVYQVEIIGPAGLSATVSYTADSSATIAEIVAGLVSAINTAALGVTATDISSTNVRCKAASAGLWFSVTVLNTALLRAQQTHADPGIATDLAAIQLADNDWYGLTLTTMGEAEIIAAGGWVESAKKLYVQQTQDGDSITSSTTDVVSEVQDDNLFRTAIIYGQNPSQFVGAAWLGKVFPFNPGATTWKFQRLAGVSASPLTSTEQNNLVGTPSIPTKNGNAVIDYGGIPITTEGRTAAGEWIDVIRDRDWFEARLQARIVNLKIQASANGKKIPFTDAGIAQVEAEVVAQCREGIGAGFIADSPAPVVTVPRASAVSSADKAARRLTGVNFSATIAGAIHLSVITGTISV